MRQEVDLNTWATPQAVNKVALVTVKDNDFLNKQQWAIVTHFVMMQYSFKKALKLYRGRADVSMDFCGL